jgi:hypothetical protein
MFSINTLKERLKKNEDVSLWRYGYHVQIHDPDQPSMVQGEYFFSRKDGEYTLICATYYYRVYNVKIVPSLNYSVYCKDTKDPKIKEVVDSLYTLKQ